MSADRVFLDTNVIVYSFDSAAPGKQARAKELMASADWVVSWQVIQEFANVAMHRFKVPMSAGDLEDDLHLVLWPRCAVMRSLGLHKAALQIHVQAQYRFYDSMVVVPALAAGCHTLISEDLQDSRQIGQLVIRNPFA
jgi:predicted nucleic acid-binding protein